MTQIFTFKTGINTCYVLKESWVKVLNMGARTIYPGHGNPFAIERITKLLN